MHLRERERKVVREIMDGVKLSCFAECDPEFPLPCAVCRMGCCGTVGHHCALQATRRRTSRVPDPALLRLASVSFARGIASALSRIQSAWS